MCFVAKGRFFAALLMREERGGDFSSLYGSFVAARKKRGDLS